MSSLAVVKTGGKQYIVKNGDEIVVDLIQGEVGSKVELVKLAEFAADGSSVKVDATTLGTPVGAEIMESGKGEKIRVAKFKSKVRYRKVNGFRPQLTRLKIVAI